VAALPSFGPCLVALERLSESLRAHRADSGAHPAALGRADIEHHLHRLAFLNSQGELSDFSRIRARRELKWVLQQMRSLGLTRPGQPSRPQRSNRGGGACSIAACSSLAAITARSSDTAAARQSPLRCCALGHNQFDAAERHSWPSG
jgi:hypothetical protein